MLTAGWLNTADERNTFPASGFLFKKKSLKRFLIKTVNVGLTKLNHDRKNT